MLRLFKTNLVQILAEQGSGSGVLQWILLPKCKTWSVTGWGSKPRHPAVVTIVRVKYEISDSVTVALRASGEELGLLCWEIKLSQSEPFHIIDQSHLLSGRSGEAFPTNATRLAGSFILCFTTPTLPLSIFYPEFFRFLSHQVKLVLSSFLIYLTSFAFISFHFSAMLLFPSYWLCVAEVCDGSPHYTGEMGLVALQTGARF